MLRAGDQVPNDGYSQALPEYRGTGTHFAVAQEGEIDRGNPIELAARAAAGLTIADILRL
jgi:hypothetical protein